MRSATHGVKGATNGMVRIAEGTHTYRNIRTWANAHRCMSAKAKLRTYKCFASQNPDAETLQFCEVQIAYLSNKIASWK